MSGDEGRQKDCEGRLNDLDTFLNDLIYMVFILCAC